MGTVKIPYYVLKRNGRGFWQPNTAMREKGYRSVPCGPDGPAAWAIAQAAYEGYLRKERGQDEPAPINTFPTGSLGDAWEKYRRTDEWPRKAKATREEWDRVWKWLKPTFGDVLPETITLEEVSLLRTTVEAKVSLREAHRVIKVWRAFWKIMAVLKVEEGGILTYCDAAKDPSKAVVNSAAPGRSDTWQEGEAVRMVKGAWRLKYHGLAVAIAIAWDSQLSPIDVRLLTIGLMSKDKAGTWFDLSRAKTGQGALATLSRRTERLLDAYLAMLGPAQPLPSLPVCRNRSGGRYLKNALSEDFRDVRAVVFPLDTRKLMDMRRSGATEAIAGGARAEALASKMGNSIDQSSELQKTYLPNQVQTVRQVDDARRRGRSILRKSLT